MPLSTTSTTSREPTVPIRAESSSVSSTSVSTAVFYSAAASFSAVHDSITPSPSSASAAAGSSEAEVRPLFWGIGPVSARTSVRTPPLLQPATPAVPPTDNLLGWTVETPFAWSSEPSRPMRCPRSWTLEERWSRHPQLLQRHTSTPVAPPSVRDLTLPVSRRGSASEVRDMADNITFSVDANDRTTPISVVAAVAAASPVSLGHASSNGTAATATALAAASLTAVPRRRRQCGVYWMKQIQCRCVAASVPLTAAELRAPASPASRVGSSTSQSCPASPLHQDSAASPLLSTTLPKYTWHDPLQASRHRENPGPLVTTRGTEAADSASIDTAATSERSGQGTAPFFSSNARTNRTTRSLTTNNTTALFSLSHAHDAAVAAAAVSATVREEAEDGRRSTRSLPTKSIRTTTISGPSSSSFLVATHATPPALHGRTTAEGGTAHTVLHPSPGNSTWMPELPLWTPPTPRPSGLSSANSSHRAGASPALRHTSSVPVPTVMVGCGGGCNSSSNGLAGSGLTGSSAIQFRTPALAGDGANAASPSSPLVFRALSPQQTSSTALGDPLERASSEEESRTSLSASATAGRAPAQQQQSPWWLSQDASLATPSPLQVDPVRTDGQPAHVTAQSPPLSVPSSSGTTSKPVAPAMVSMNPTMNASFGTMHCSMRTTPALHDALSTRSMSAASLIPVAAETTPVSNTASYSWRGSFAAVDLAPVGKPLEANVSWACMAGEGEVPSRLSFPTSSTAAPLSKDRRSSSETSSSGEEEKRNAVTQRRKGSSAMSEAPKTQTQREDAAMLLVVPAGIASSWSAVVAATPTIVAKDRFRWTTTTPPDAAIAFVEHRLLSSRTSQRTSLGSDEEQHEEEEQVVTYFPVHTAVLKRHGAYFSSLLGESGCRYVAHRPDEYVNLDALPPCEAEGNAADTPAERASTEERGVGMSSMDEMDPDHPHTVPVYYIADPCDHDHDVFGTTSSSRRSRCCTTGKSQGGTTAPSKRRAVSVTAVAQLLHFLYTGALPIFISHRNSSQEAIVVLESAASTSFPQQYVELYTLAVYTGLDALSNGLLNTLWRILALSCEVLPLWSEAIEWGLAEVQALCEQWMVHHLEHLLRATTAQGLWRTFSLPQVWLLTQLRQDAIAAAKNGAKEEGEEEGEPAVVLAEASIHSGSDRRAGTALNTFGRSGPQVQHSAAAGAELLSSLTMGSVSRSGGGGATSSSPHRPRGTAQAEHVSGTARRHVRVLPPPVEATANTPFLAPSPVMSASHTPRFPSTPSVQSPFPFTSLSLPNYVRCLENETATMTWATLSSNINSTATTAPILMGVPTPPSRHGTDYESETMSPNSSSRGTRPLASSVPSAATPSSSSAGRRHFWNEDARPPPLPPLASSASSPTRWLATGTPRSTSSAALIFAAMPNATTATEREEESSSNSSADMVDETGSDVESVMEVLRGFSQYPMAPTAATAPTAPDTALGNQVNDASAAGSGAPAAAAPSAVSGPSVRFQSPTTGRVFAPAAAVQLQRSSSASSSLAASQVRHGANSPTGSVRSRRTEGVHTSGNATSNSVPARPRTRWTLLPPSLQLQADGSWRVGGYGRLYTLDKREELERRQAYWSGKEMSGHPSGFRGMGSGGQDPWTVRGAHERDSVCVSATSSPSTRLLSESELLMRLWTWWVSQGAPEDSPVGEEGDDDDGAPALAAARLLRMVRLSDVKVEVLNMSPDTARQSPLPAVVAAVEAFLAMHPEKE